MSQVSKGTWSLRRYCRDLADIQFSIELDTNCPVPGSYGLDFIATARMHGGLPDRRFSMARSRRYDPKTSVDTQNRPVIDS